MGLITPDFSEAQDSTPIPPGTYSARIIEGQVTTAKSSGAPMVKWKYELVNAAKQTGRIVFQNTMVTGPGAGQLERLIVAATGEKPAAGQGFDTDTLLGREVTLVLAQGHRMDGSPSDWPDVKRVLPKSDAEPSF